VIDLHLHTTASDGRLAPAALVALAADSGLRIIAVTDHDTVAGLEEARAAARARGIRLVDGIEVTAIECGRDVHVLGYFFDPGNAALAQLLDRQRAARIERVREIGSRLAAYAIAVDVGALIEAAAVEQRTIGRPAIADALVAGGHAVDRHDAFERWLGAGAPAFVERRGPSLGEAVEAIARAGGIASLAHPGLLGLDEHIPRFAGCGLDAIEARHRDHDAEAESRYRGIAAALDLAVSGGSDFHGEHERGRTGAASRPGSVALAPEDFAALESRVGRGRKVNTGA
jgi:predicted metal-dependent phosphoesterase TrpH